MELIKESLLTVIKHTGITIFSLNRLILIFIPPKENYTITIEKSDIFIDNLEEKVII